MHLHVSAVDFSVDVAVGIANRKVKFDFFLFAILSKNIGIGREYTIYLLIVLQENLKNKGILYSINYI